MIEIFHNIGCILIILVIVLYIHNFVDINNELIFRSKLILQNTRNYYYNIFYPKGYFFIKDKPKVNTIYKENTKQYYYRRSLYNRKIMKK